MIRSHETGLEPQLFQGQSQENHKVKARLDTIVRCYLKVKSGRGVESGDLAHWLFYFAFCCSDQN